MKITHLLAQYLYQNNKLDLQGIGHFLLEKELNIDTSDNNSTKEPGIEGITFENNKTALEDPELINFISKYTGKIKALASADLNSHLELAKQFLNIGKPFLFEGIGSLTKIRSGEYSFVPGVVLTEKLFEQRIVGTRASATNEEPVSDYKSALYKKSPKTDWKKPTAFIFVIIGIGLAIWGGYTVYKNNAVQKTLNKESLPVAKESTLLLEDSIVTNIDSNKNELKETVQTVSGATKFILEVGDKEKTLLRYNQLRNFKWDVLMETKDSINYKIFLLIPDNTMNASRIIDSLTKLTGKKVYIEK